MVGLQVDNVLWRRDRERETWGWRDVNFKWEEIVGDGGGGGGPSRAE